MAVQFRLGKQHNWFLPDKERRYKDKIKRESGCLVGTAMNCGGEDLKETIPASLSFLVYIRLFGLCNTMGLCSAVFQDLTTISGGRPCNGPGERREEENLVSSFRCASPHSCQTHRHTKDPACTTTYNQPYTHRHVHKRASTHTHTHTHTHCHTRTHTSITQTKCSTRKKCPYLPRHFTVQSMTPARVWVINWSQRGRVCCSLLIWMLMWPHSAPLI